MQLTVVKHACRGLTSEWLVHPVEPHDSGRTQAQGRVRVLADALGKTLDHLTSQAGLETEIPTADRHRPNSSPQPRPRTPAVLLRTVGRLPSGALLGETTAGRKRAPRRVARPGPEPAQIRAAGKLQLPQGRTPERQRE